MPIQTNKLATALAKAKKAVKKALPLKKGASVTITNRLYALVDEKGRLLPTTGTQFIYASREAARAAVAEYGSSKTLVVRLNDITGLVQ